MFQNRKIDLVDYCGMWLPPGRHNHFVDLSLALTLCSGFVLTACSSDATAPSPQPVSLTGAWNGSDRFTTCTGGVDPRTCGRLNGQTGAVKLTLSQTGATVAGTLTADVIAPGSTNNPFLTTTSIPVTGTVTTDGAMRLSGSATIDQTAFGVETATLSNWTSTLSGTDMVGQFQATVSGYYPGFGLPQSFVVSADVRLTKQS